MYCAPVGAFFLPRANPGRFHLRNDRVLVYANCLCSGCVGFPRLCMLYRLADSSLPSVSVAPSLAIRSRVSQPCSDSRVRGGWITSIQLGWAPRSCSAACTRRAGRWPGRVGPQHRASVPRRRGSGDVPFACRLAEPGGRQSGGRASTGRWCGAWSFPSAQDGLFAVEWRPRISVRSKGSDL